MYHYLDFHHQLHLLLHQGLVYHYFQFFDMLLFRLHLFLLLHQYLLDLHIFLHRLHLHKLQKNLLLKMLYHYHLHLLLNQIHYFQQHLLHLLLHHQNLDQHQHHYHHYFLGLVLCLVCFLNPLDQDFAKNLHLQIHHPQHYKEKKLH
jgi:hypothetical protein